MSREGIDSFLNSAASLLGGFEGYRDAADGLRQIAESARQPFNLAVVGRMKTGKSTLINGLVGQSLAISDVEEATATLNWIGHGFGEQLRSFVVQWRDGRSEPFPLGELSQWTGKSAEVLARVRETLFLRLFSDSPRLAEVQIVDTPGTGSAAEEHEVAREFLNPEAIADSISQGGKADAIIYVVGPVGREQDEETLQVFSSGRLPNSGPYNSVAVLHKWDALAVEDPKAEAKEKARRLLGQLNGAVAEVVPVSGPLALAARAAPDEFFGELLSVVRNNPDQLESALRMSERWAKDPSRQAVREWHAMPWPSFKLLVRLCLKEDPPDSAAFRQRCLEESGIQELESLLQDRFFSQASIIKQCQVLTRAASILEPALRRMDDAASRKKADSRFAEQAVELLKDTDAGVSLWLSDQAADCRDRAEALRAAAVKTDRQWQDHRGELERLQMDLRISRELEVRADIFPSEHREIIRAVCDHLASLQRRRDLGRGRTIPLGEVEGLIGFYRERENMSRRQDRPLFAHLVSRLEAIHSALSSNF